MSNFIWKLVMTLCFYSIVVIIYIMNRNDTKPKKNIILGATIPYTHLNDEGVKTIVAKFKKNATITFIILTLTIVPALFLDSTASICYGLAWCMPALLIQYIPFILANKALRKYKKDNNLKGEATKIADLKLSTVEIKAASPLHSLVPLVLSLAPLIYLCINRPTQGFWGLFASFLSITGCIALCMGIHIFLGRRKRDVVGEDTDINYQLSLIRSRNWSKMYIGLNYILMLNSLVLGADLMWDGLPPIASYISVMALSVFTILFAMYVEFDTRKKQQQYTMQNVAASNTILDEDDYWIYGMFYYNPKDTRLMIPDRVGSNTTVNMGKPVGMFLMILSALLMVAMPAVSGFIYVVDTTPMSVKFSDTAIVCTHLNVDYNIKMSDVDSIEYKDECPVLTSRVNGYGTERVSKGTFTSTDYGLCQVFVPGDADKFAVITAKDGSIYIIGWDKDSNLNTSYSTNKKVN